MPLRARTPVRPPLLARTSCASRVIVRSNADTTDLVTERQWCFLLEWTLLAVRYCRAGYVEGILIGVSAKSYELAKPTMTDHKDGPLLAARRMDKKDGPTPSMMSCPHCGRRPTGSLKPPARPRRRAYYIAGLLALVAAGAGTIVILRHSQDQKKQRAAALAARLAHLEQVEEEKLRPALEGRLEQAIASDARKLARAGALGGPILGATCTSMSMPGTTGAVSSTRSYNCIAIQRRRGLTIEGARFFGTIDTRTDGFTFHGD
jgi:hypothetical protein